MPLHSGALVSQPYRIVDDLERIHDLAAEIRDKGQGGHGDANGQVVLGRGGRGPGLLSAGGRAAEVPQPEAAEACPRLSGSSFGPAEHV